MQSIAQITGVNFQLADGFKKSSCVDEEPKTPAASQSCPGDRGNKFRQVVFAAVLGGSKMPKNTDSKSRPR